ncbi:MAG: Insertion element protein [Actinobacteria bacterium]|nr:Insertion element protein [Actinomycetota bacterium]
MAEGSARAQPFYCPFCSETDLRPAEEERQWVCLSCTRKFELKFLGLSR